MDCEALETALAILTAKEVSKTGLEFVCFSQGRPDRAQAKTNVKQFKDHCGCSQHIVAHIFEDPQIAQIECARLDRKKISIKCCLQAFSFLHACDVKNRREPVFDLSLKTMQKWVWHCAAKIWGLEHQKIIWPPSFPATDVWVLSVDCTDSPIEETDHPELSQLDKDLFFFKLNGAGL